MEEKKVSTENTTEVVPMNNHHNGEWQRLFPDKKGNSLSSLQIYPKSVKFATQDEGEQVFILTRAHVITNIGWIMTSILGIAVAFLFQPILLFLNLNVTAFNDRPFFGLSITFVYLAVLFAYILDNFLKWYFNVYIITDKRILDYDYEAYKQYKISEASLVNIEDVTQRQVGLFPALFNYGNITIQTAAERMQFEFEKVPNPSYLRDKIMDLSDLLRKEIEHDPHS
ncbi:MAG: PH domain-containing protein [bacterium]